MIVAILVIAFALDMLGWNRLIAEAVRRRWALSPTERERLQALELAEADRQIALAETEKRRS